MQILSAIANFLIYKNERSQERKKYELFTTAFILGLILINSLFNFSWVSFSINTRINALSFLPTFVGLTLISLFLTIWYLGITFGEFKVLNLKNWWHFPLALATAIFTLLVFWHMIMSQSLLPTQGL